MTDVRSDLLIWKKSSLSYANGGCIEVATGPSEGIYVRDSKNPGGLVLRFSLQDWNSFSHSICAAHSEFR